MRIINISFALLLVCSFKPLSGMAVIKGEGSPESGQDGNSGETTQAPEGTDVRSTKPETDSLNDVALPQLPTHLKETEPVPSNSPLTKRCARTGTLLGSRSGGPRLSLARRDLTNTRKQLCENCQKSILCKNHNPCARCNRWCDDISTPSPIEKEDTNPQTERPEEKREVVDSPQNTNNQANEQDVVVSSRFRGDDDDTVSRYYSLASVEVGPLMQLFKKLFNIPDGFEKFIILGKLKGKPKQDSNNILVTDLAQAFGSDNKTQISIHKFDNSDIANVNLVRELNDKLDELIKRKIQETGNSQLGLDEVNRLIDEAMGQISNSVGNPQEHSTTAPEAVTRCNVDEAVEDFMDMLPNAYGRPHHDERPPAPPPIQPQIQPISYESEESTEIKNPPVIQDNLNYVGKKLQDTKAPPKNVEDDYIDDTEEARPIAITENKNQPPVQEATRITTVPKETDSASSQNVVGEAPENVLSLSDAKSIPSSDNQVNGPALQERTNFDKVGEPAPPSPSQDLEKNVIKIVEDSLKAVTDGQNILQSPIENTNFAPIGEEAPRQMFVDESKPNQANSDSVIKTYERPPPKDEILQTQENLEPEKGLTNVDLNTIEEPQKPEQTTKRSRPLTNFDYQDPTQLSVDELDPIPEVPNVAEMAPNFENRGQFADGENSREKYNYFGSLVPAKGVSTDVADPRMKKVIYVGDNINLPLKMFQDENGVMKLRVDTDALCNCKNQNCTKKHVDERFRTAVRGNEEQNLGLPILNVGFGGDSHQGKDLMNSFVESLHDHSEGSEVFKRSANIEPEISVDEEIQKDVKNEKLDIENEIKKLTEDIEKYTKANKDLFNKGTLGFFRDVEKTKNVDRMITLASNLLSWMKDFAMKHLES